MQILPHNLNSLHHAYFFTLTNRKEGSEYLKKDIENILNLKLSGHVDFVFREYEKMAILNAHELKAIVLNKPIERRIVIISVSLIMLEAQNALLKLFEEPPEKNHFFILSETDAYLLPTLRSRMFLKNFSLKEDKKEALEFLNKSLKEKMEYVAKLAEEESGSVRHFISDLERILHKDLKKNKKVLEKIIEAKYFLTLSSAHKKGILESITLSI